MKALGGWRAISGMRTDVPLTKPFSGYSSLSVHRSHSTSSDGPVGRLHFVVIIMKRDGGTVIKITYLARREGPELGIEC